MNGTEKKIKEIDAVYSPFSMLGGKGGMKKMRIGLLIRAMWLI